MKIILGKPPNYEAIVAAIPAAAGPKVMFTYGDQIFMSRSDDLPQWLIAHEEIHSLRQGRDPDEWWKRYLTDMQFRFDEELIAHRIEWTTWMHHRVRNRKERRGMIATIAKRLSGPLYGKMVSYDRAVELITNDNIPAEYPRPIAVM